MGRHRLATTGVYGVLWLATARAALCTSHTSSETCKSRSVDTEGCAWNGSACAPSTRPLPPGTVGVKGVAREDASQAAIQPWTGSSSSDDTFDAPPAPEQVRFCMWSQQDARRCSHALLRLAHAAGRCESFQVGDSAEFCELPAEKGPCRAALVRWYWDGRQCTAFRYGGCRGNVNSFDSRGGGEVVHRRYFGVRHCCRCRRCAGAASMSHAT